MNKHLESTQFLIIARTQSFLDSRSPFIDMTAVSFQREQRKKEQKLQLAERQYQDQLRREKEQKATGGMVMRDSGTQNNNNNNAANNYSSSSPSTARDSPRGHESGNQNKNEDGNILDEEEDQGPKKPTTQQLLSPNAFLGDFCIVFGVSALCEHLLRLYENEILAERSRRNLMTKKIMMSKKKKDESRNNNNSIVNKKNLENNGDTNNNQEEEDNNNNYNNNNKAIDYDQQFEDPLNDLSTTYPIQAAPSHFQYDGGVLTRFLEELPMLSVFELSTGDGNEFSTSSSSASASSGKGGNKEASSSSGLDEPRYIPRGLLWIKSQLLTYLEGRAKTIEAPSTS